MRTQRFTLLVSIVVLLVFPTACSHQGIHLGSADVIEGYQPPPGWIKSLRFPEGKLCSIGVAGPGTTLDGPKELSRSRAVDDLAHSIETMVWEGIIDKERNGVAAVRSQEIVGTSGELILELREDASVDWWFDAIGEGYVGLPKYTYARVCTAHLGGQSGIVDKLSRTSGLYAGLAGGPAWLEGDFPRLDGRLCAVGLSRRTYDPSDALEQASQDVRAQLSVSLFALVSTLTEERQTTRRFTSESTVVGLNLGEVKGAVVRDQWFDREGVGPLQEKGAAYAYGCVFPEIEFERKRRKALSQGREDQAKAYEQARTDARAFFDALDEEEEKRAGQ